MRRLALALVLVAGCGPVRTEELIPRYVILTTIPAESPMTASIQRLALRRSAEVFRFRNLDRDRDAVLAWLRKAQPTYCALILPPGQIDAAFQLAFFEIACRIDDDPFPDFAWGYIPAADGPSLQFLMERLEAAEAKVERRLFRATRFRPGAASSEIRDDRLEWATGLPLRTLSVKDGDVPYLRKNLVAVEECDFLLLEGEGAPDGLRGLPREELERLRLDGTIVFSGASYTGVLGASFDASADVLRRRTFDPEQSFAQTLLRRGAAAILAPLDKAEPRLIEREWTDAVLSDEPLGWVTKHAYDLAILSSGATAPTLELPRDAAKPPTGFGSPLVQSATRILIGDPMLKLHSRQHLQPLRYVSTQRTEDKEGRPILNVTYRVGAWDCAGFFEDPRGGDSRIHLKIPLPRDTYRAHAALSRAEAPGKPVEARLTASAVEQWRGESFLHVLVQGKSLALEDLVFAFQITLDR